jgi:hypothetical protein
MEGGPAEPALFVSELQLRFGPTGLAPQAYLACPECLLERV